MADSTSHEENFLSFDNNTVSPRGNYNHRGSRGGRRPRFNHHYNNSYSSPKFSTPYEKNFQKNHPYMKHEFSPVFQDKYKQKSSFDNSQKKQHNSSGCPKTPLKDIPINNFVTSDMISDPWAELESNSIKLLENSTSASIVDDSDKFNDTNISYSIERSPEHTSSDNEIPDSPVSHSKLQNSQLSSSNSEKDINSESDT